MRIAFPDATFPLHNLWTTRIKAPECNAQTSEHDRSNHMPIIMRWHLMRLCVESWSNHAKSMSTRGSHESEDALVIMILEYMLISRYSLPYNASITVEC